jgi:hypothetical protein
MSTKPKADKPQPAPSAPLNKTERTRIACSPITRNAVTAQEYGAHFGELDLGEALEVMRDSTKAIHAGDTKRIETTLIAQADALDAIFSHMAHRAALNVGEYIGAAETYMKLALRAQSQCRATLETLATIKNPPNVAFVRQANIAHGPQQVNNGDPNKTEHSPFAPARAGQNANSPTELLESPHAKPQWMDAATPDATSGADTPMAAVATIERAKDG